MNIEDIKLDELGKSVIHFNVPQHLRTSFDHLCKIRGETRTRILMELMRTYINENTAGAMAEWKRGANIDHH